MSAHSTSEPQSAAARLQSASARAENLNERLIRLRAAKEANDEALKELSRQAMQEFGTCDLEQMRQIYQQKMNEQNSALTAYEQELERIEAIVSSIEQQARGAAQGS